VGGEASGEVAYLYVISYGLERAKGKTEFSAWKRVAVRVGGLGLLCSGAVRWRAVCLCSGLTTADRFDATGA